MSALEKIEKSRLIFGIYLLVLIVCIELVIHHWHLPAWPVFLIMILFFETHMDKTKATKLIVGGLVGVCCYLMTVAFVEMAAPLMGAAVARLLFICLVVYSIVVFGEIFPIVFNNYAFLFFLISGLAAQAGGGAAQPLLWIAMILVGGGFVIFGILGIGKLMQMTAASSTQSAEDSKSTEGAN